MGRPSWVDTWFDVALAMSERSLCTRRSVGAVLVHDNRVISTGYNGTPPKQPECSDGGCPRGGLTGPLPEDYDTYVCHGLHAEANALLRAGSAASGSDLYITHRPCPQCQNLIMGAGVAYVWWLDYATETGWRMWWVENGRLTDV